MHRIGSLAVTLGIDGLAPALRPLTATGRVVELDPEHARDTAGGWRDHEWGVDWPYPASELAAATSS